MNSKLFAKVTIPNSGLDFFTYSVPEHLREKAHPGKVVLVPFLKAKSKGVILEFQDTTDLPLEKIKEIENIIDDSFSTTPTHLELAQWMSEYYITPLSDVIQLFFPPGIIERGRYVYRLKKLKNYPNDIPVVNFLLQQKDKRASLKKLQEIFGSGITHTLRTLEKEGIIELEVRVKTRKYRELSYYSSIPIEIPQNPTPHQMEVITKFFESQAPVSLLFGVTGSGKTRVYSWIIEKFIQNGKSAIILVPEIALTPQIFNYFSHIFGNLVVFYHSRLTDAERRWVFKEVREGRKKILVGPRSALFLPIKDLGIIIIDEEHDSSYKEMERNPMYHARDVAIKLGQLLGIPVLLGSATPSMESYYSAISGKYQLLSLRERVPYYKLPHIEVIDMRKRKSEYLFSAELLTEIHKALKDKKQVILFLNRRGYSTSLICQDCGTFIKCPNCSVNLVFHKIDNKLHCHICGHSEPPPEYCPVCQSQNLKFVGTGTQKIEESIKKLFPQIQVKRFDLDAFVKEGLSYDTFREFFEGKLNLLVGTKMVGKGFDFQSLGLVGVVNADIGLGLPDFRAEEKVFQLLLQIAGRIRRGGKVLIQTFSPDSRAIKYAAQMDFETFANLELDERRKFNYPPFVNLTLIEVSGPDIEKVREFSNLIKSKILEFNEEGLEVLGPVPSPISKKGGSFIIRLILKYRNKEFPVKLNFLRNLSTPRQITLSVDVDPQEMV